MANRSYRHVTGFGQVSAILQGVSKEMKTSIMSKGVEAGAKILVVHAKRFARRSERTGALRASIDYVVRKYEFEGVAVAIVGPTRNYFRGRKRLGKDDDRRGAEQPARYAHLVEFGHNVVVGGDLKEKRELSLQGTGKFSKNGNELKRWKKTGKVLREATGKVKGWVAPKPFLRPAHYAAQGQIQGVVVRTMSQEIEKIIRKAPKAA